MIGAGPDLGGQDVARRTVGPAVLAFAGSALDGVTAVVTSRVLGPEGRGLFAIALTLSALVAVVACLGVTTAARVGLVTNPPRLTLGEYLGAAPVHTVAGGAAGFLTVAALVLGVLHTGTWPLAAAGGLVAAGLTASTFVIDGLHARGRHAWATGTNSAGSLLALALTLGLAASGSTSVPAYLLALAGSLLVQSAVGLVALGRDGRLSLTYRRSAHAGLVRAGLPALPYLSATLVTSRLDRYLVGALGGVAAAGVYSVAATASEVCRPLPTALGQVLLYGRASGRIPRHLERRARTLVTCMIVATLVLVGLVAEPLVRGLFGTDFLGAVWPLRILLLGEVFISVWLVDSRILIGSGRMGAASATTVLSSVVLVVGDLILVPPFGIEGAAVASVVAYAAAAGGAAWLLRR